MSRVVRVGMMKALPVKWELEQNMKVFEKLVKGAHDEGVQLFLTCECFLDGYCVSPKDGNVMDEDKFYNYAAVSNDSPYIHRVKEIAKEYKMHILFGYSRNYGDKKVQNSAILIDDEGKEIGEYHKIICSQHDEIYTPGDDIPVFETKLGRFGILICADRRWPEHAAVSKVKGAEALLLPTYGMRHEKNECWMKTRAYENEFWVLFNHPTVCFICDPNGDVVAKLDSNFDDVLIYDMDLDYKKKKQSKCLTRRPELYGALSKAK